MSLKGSKLPKLSRLVYVVEVISVLYVIDQKNEWSVFVEWKVSGQTVMPLEGGQWMVT